MIDLHQQIADLETEIDDLSEAAERCRKSMIIAKAAIAGGLLILAATLFGVIWSDAISLVAGIAATLIGTVFYGSSRSTREQIAAKIRLYEARRAELIDGMSLRVVDTH